jgi:hypothetical protein
VALALRIETGCRSGSCVARCYACAAARESITRSRAGSNGIGRESSRCGSARCAYCKSACRDTGTCAGSCSTSGESSSCTRAGYSDREASGQGAGYSALAVLRGSRGGTSSIASDLTRRTLNWSAAAIGVDPKCLQYFGRFGATSDLRLFQQNRPEADVRHNENQPRLAWPSRTRLRKSQGEIALATRCAQAMSRSITGLRVRFFSVMIVRGHDRAGIPTDTIFSPYRTRSRR